jgi:4-methylaminobutanoate oxidase (formaldehyde-forming)
MIVTGTAFGTHDLAWIRKHAPEPVRVVDVTGQFACFALWGPEAGKVLAGVASDLDFPYLT